jgi:hypothetical protein
MVRGAASRPRQQIAQPCCCATRGRGSGACGIVAGSSGRQRRMVRSMTSPETATAWRVLRRFVAEADRRPPHLALESPLTIAEWKEIGQGGRMTEFQARTIASRPSRAMATPMRRTMSTGPGQSERTAARSASFATARACPPRHRSVRRVFDQSVPNLPSPSDFGRTAIRSSQLSKLSDGSFPHFNTAIGRLRRGTRVGQKGDAVCAAAWLAWRAGGLELAVGPHPLGPAQSAVASGLRSRLHGGRSNPSPARLFRVGGQPGRWSMASLASSPGPGDLHARQIEITDRRRPGQRRR